MAASNGRVDRVVNFIFIIKVNGNIFMKLILISGEGEVGLPLLFVRRGH